MKKKNIVMTILTALICSLFFTCIPCLAYESLDTDRDVSLTVSFGSETDAFSNVHFQIYKVADIDETVHFTLSDAFAEYPVEVNDLDSEGWRELAETLDAFVTRDSIACTQEGDTDASGKVVFTGLSQGLYLVSSSSFYQDETKYTSQAVLVSLPNYDTEKDMWIYDVGSNCKYESEAITSITAIKIWKDEGYEVKRPSSIAVKLYQDGTLIDTKELNVSNNWEYTWTALDPSYSYQVVEDKVPSGYTVRIQKENGTYEIINTYKKDTPKKEKIPNTGVLWWPVPLLAGTGVLLYMIGWYQKRKHET